jgi:large subunit ribosomal protein L46
MRGEAKPNKEEGLVDYAWCTREELKEKVDGQYYESIKHALAE